MKRQASMLEQKFYQEQSDRLVKMIKEHPDRNQNKPTPIAIKDAVNLARKQLHDMGYRPTSAGLFMEDEDDPATNMHPSNDDAWCNSRMQMQKIVREAQEKAART